MFEMTQLPNTDANSDIKDIKRLLDDGLIKRENKKFRRLYVMFHKLNYLITEVVKGNYAEELFVNNIRTTELYNYTQITFDLNDFRWISNEVTEDDFVLIIPPSYENNNTDHDESFHNNTKTNLQKNIQNFIEELDKKQATFIMLYGRLDKPNDYPVFWQSGHVIYLSKVDDDKCRDSLHHLYLSRNLAKLAMTPAHYGRSIQPLFYRIVEVQAEQNPNRIAIVCDRYNLNYKELNEAANKFARLLINQNIIYIQDECNKQNKDCVIVIALDRDDPQLAIAKLAIEKLGATYTLFNTDHSRLPLYTAVKRLVTSQADFIVTYNEYFHKLISVPAALDSQIGNNIHHIEVIRNDIAFNNIFNNLLNNSVENTQNLNRNVSPQHVVSHTYTSGSTGVPKAARIAARGYPFAAIAHIDAGRLNFSTNTLQFSTVDFDASQLEEKMTLAAAGRLVLMNQIAYSDHIKLMDILKRYSINCLTVTPNMLSLLLTHSHFPFISFCLVVGDNVTKELLDKFWDKLAVYNKPFYILVGYGTTQTTIQGAYLIYEKGKPLTVGYPALGVNIELFSLKKLENFVNTQDHFTRKLIENSGATILKPQDEEDNVIEGVICTYGPCNMLGYVGSKTVEEDVLYNTKDIGYLLKSGMKVKGRIGRFVKINGQLVDLSEIEAVLKEYKEMVQDCRAIVHVRNVKETQVNVIAVYIIPVNKKLIIKDAGSPSRASLDALKDLQLFMRKKLSIWKIPALVNTLFVAELLIKNNDKMSFDDQEMCRRWRSPCIRLHGSKILYNSAEFSVEGWKFIRQAQQIAAECVDLLPNEIPLDCNLIELGFDSLQLIRFIVRLKLIDLKAMGLDNEKFIKALQVLSVDDFKNIGSIFELFKYLRLHSQIYRNRSDDRVNLIERLPSKSSEKFMLTDYRIYNYESYGEIEETIWWVPSLLGNGSLDYGTSKILQLPLHNHFLECPDLNYLRQLKSIDDLADHYIKSIVPSCGFVFLGGWSSGGLLCKKIKEKLQKNGIKVILFLLDTVFPERLQQMSSLEFAKEIYDIANKIRGSILLLLSLPETTQFYIPSLEELNETKVKEDQLVRLMGHLQISFTLLCKSNNQLDAQAITKCLKVIEYAQIFLKAEIDSLVPFKAELNESDYFIVSDASIAKYGKNLGWKANNAHVEFIENTDHFSLLHNMQLVNFIKKIIIKELTNLMKPYYQGLAYYMSHNYSQAIECFNKVQQKNSGNYEFLRARSLAYLNMQSYEKSLTDIKQYIEKVPADINALVLCAKVLTYLERYIEALEIYLKILSLTNDVNEIKKFAYSFAVVVLTRRFDDVVAEHPFIKNAQEFIHANPILMSYFFCTEVMYILKINTDIDKNTKNILEDLITSAIRNDPENMMAYILSAKINFQLTNYSVARGDLNKAVLLGANKELLMFDYGMIDYHEENNQEAIDKLSKVILQNNNNKGEAYHYRGLAHLRLNQINEAIADFTSAYDIQNDIKQLFARGNAYLAQKMFEKAYCDFVKIIEKGSSNVMVYYKAALSCKGMITLTNRNEVKEISRLYTENSEYLAKAKICLGEESSFLKKQIEDELSNMKKQFEIFNKENNIKITLQDFDGAALKTSGTLSKTWIFKDTEKQNQRRQVISAMAERHLHDDSRAQSFMPTNQS